MRADGILESGGVDSLVAFGLADLSRNEMADESLATGGIHFLLTGVDSSVDGRGSDFFGGAGGRNILVPITNLLLCC